MTAIINLIFLTFLQLLSGFGLLTLFRMQLKPFLHISVSLLLGVALSSLLPFLLELALIPLTSFAISISLILVTVLLNLRFHKGIRQFKNSWKNYELRFQLYEIPLLIIAASIVIISVWRCFYFPPTPRDLVSGPEVIAAYAVKEKTMINSVFSVNLESTNNPFKPAFITSLQIIYKYAGFEFGQIWLSIIFIAFLVFLYGILTIHLHRLLAALLLIFFIVIPELYAYTLMALFDYSNAVYFCLSLYFLFNYFDNRQTSCLIFSGLLMALATYTRSETLILALLVTLALLMHHRRNNDHPLQFVSTGFYFLFPSVIIYLLSVTVYIKYYLPVSYNVEGLLRQNLWDLSPLLKRFWDMNDQLIFSNDGVNYFGYFIFLFVALLLVDAVWKEPWDSRSLNWLFGVLVIYTGLPLIAFLFPLFDLDHSTKRGLFKIFPLMLLYMANSRFLRHVSERISIWETKRKINTSA